MSQFVGNARRAEITNRKNQITNKAQFSTTKDNVAQIEIGVISTAARHERSEEICFADETARFLHSKIC